MDFVLPAPRGPLRFPAPAGTEAYGIVILPPAPAAGEEARPALPLRALLALARGGAAAAG